MENIYNAIQNVYNMDKTTWQEVLAELYNLVSKVENKFDLFETKFGPLLGEEVTIELKKMYDDGSLAALINEEVSELLDNKAKQSDLNTTNARIDNLIKNEGTSINDIELQDIRVSVDGKIYSSAGDSIRSQIREVDSKIMINKSINLFDLSKVKLQGFMNGEIGETPSLRSNSSFANYKLKVDMGEKYIVSGTSFSVLYLNSDGEIITKRSSTSVDNPNFILNVDYPNTDSVIINFKTNSYPINN